MAIAVMVVIILLNFALLLAVMRVGTKEEPHREIAAEDSAAVLAWRARLAARASQPDADASETNEA
ncbi:MAG: hypothetical protein OXG68_13245 [Chloroflexi bacterium]|nr:hypothetical protein [Chloroflexota bacterium]MCY3916870.1 hypothetical protein [Chloroflexota bacterium]